MVSVLKWILTILLIIASICVVFASQLPMWVSVICSIVSVALFFWIINDDSVKKSKMYDVKNFFVLVFWNVLLFPYITNIILEAIVLIVLFIMVVLCLVVINKEKGNTSYLKKSVRTHCMYTIVPGVFILIIDIVSTFIG